MELLQYLAMAFLGGVILNIMPCVLPVLTLKVFHTIEVFGDPKHNIRLHGIAYAAGTSSAFLAFALIVVILRTSGRVLGWGMHFQHPPFVAAITAIMFVAGLNALGVFELSVTASGGERAGVFGSFANGIFAAIMSTPCTAPFLATAAAFALAADAIWWETLLLFACVGLGLAFPYTLIGFVPALGKVLPKPGAWMETFKHLMGFTLMAAVVWLYGALQAQLTAASANWFLGFLLVLAIGLWASNRFAGMRYGRMRRWTVNLGVAALVAFAGTRMLDLDKRAAQAAPAPASAGMDDGPILEADGIAWRPFDPATIVRENGRQRPVFVDYTADWCAACKTNESLFIETNAVRQQLVASNILPMRADWTNENDTIEQWLGRLQRDGKPTSGIPAYAIYLPDHSVDVLPVTITAELVATRLRAAAARFPPVGVAQD